MLFLRNETFHKALHAITENMERIENELEQCTLSGTEGVLVLVQPKGLAYHQCQDVCLKSDKVFIQTYPLSNVRGEHCKEIASHM